MIAVETWPVQQFEQNKSSGTLKTSPEYQRRPVWAAKDQMLLVDSVARGVPVGAITLYVSDENGYETYEVIDGKQRLTAIMAYLEGKFAIKTSTIAAAAVDDDEFEQHDEVTASYHEKTYDELPTPQRMKLLQYKLPIFVVRGDRSDAIRAFSRMNRSSYSLRPQEIRNAFFSETGFLNTVIGLVDELDLETTGASRAAANSLLAQLGAISKPSWDRMQDIQLVSELLVLHLAGPQHRRDSLDHHYSLYRTPSGQAATSLAAAAEELKATITQVWAIADGTSLQAMHFPSSCEHDLYGLVGALRSRGLLTGPQLTNAKEELRTVISGFRGQVEQYIAKVRSGETFLPDEFDVLVEKYARGFLGGQINSKQRREDRISVWTEVINGVVHTLDPQSSFTDVQRRLIWINSPDKLCARCGDIVSWAEFQAGHNVAWASGGRTTVENGQVEHASCNQSAGAS